jgi:hypothetical protein
MVNASAGSSDVQLRVARVLAPLGLQVSDGGHAAVTTKTVIYDRTGGQDPLTAAWLQEFFGAPVVQLPPATGTDASAKSLVVVIGSDYARRWYGIA